jgi:hypothetical protein
VEQQLISQLRSPGLPLLLRNPKQKAAFITLHYNIVTAAFCSLIVGNPSIAARNRNNAPAST